MSMLSHWGMRPPCMHGPNVDQMHVMRSHIELISPHLGWPQLYGSTYIQIIFMCVNILLFHNAYVSYHTNIQTTIDGGGDDYHNTP